MTRTGRNATVLQMVYASKRNQCTLDCFVGAIHSPRVTGGSRVTVGTCRRVHVLQCMHAKAINGNSDTSGSPSNWCGQCAMAAFAGADRESTSWCRNPAGEPSSLVLSALLLLPSRRAVARISPTSCLSGPDNSTCHRRAWRRIRRQLPSRILQLLVDSM